MIGLYEYDNASREECIDNLYETIENLDNNYMDFEALERYGQVICRDLVDYDSDLKNNEKLEFAVYVNDLVCGTYSTKEKALKVIDEIQKFINHWGADQVYQMPADNEVK